jgi:hypothetical protein
MEEGHFLRREEPYVSLGAVQAYPSFYFVIYIQIQNCLWADFVITKKNVVKNKKRSLTLGLFFFILRVFL